MEKWINCKDCGHEFSSKLSKCPECGKAHITLKSLATSLCIIALVLASGIGIILGVMDKETKVPVINEDGSSAVISSEEKQNTEQESKDEETSSKDKNSSVSYSKTQQVSEPKKDTSSVKDTADSKQELVVKERNYPVGTRLEEDCYYTTVPKYYLDYLYKLYFMENKEMSFDEFAYTLSDEDKKSGYTGVIRNPNGAATMVLPYDKKSSVQVEQFTGLLEYIAETKRLDYINSLEHNKDFDSYDIVINCNSDELTIVQSAEIILFGLYGLEYQYHKINGSNECTINLEYADGTKDTLKMSEVIKFSE